MPRGAGGAVWGVLHPTSFSVSPALGQQRAAALLTPASHPRAAVPGTAGTPRGNPALGGPLGGVTHSEPCNSLSGSLCCQHMPARARTRMCLCTHTRTCAHMRAHAHARTMCAHICMHMCTNAHACAQMHTRAQMHAHVHTCTHTRSHAHPPGTSRSTAGARGCQACASPAPRCTRGQAAPWGCCQEPSGEAQSGDACTRQHSRLTGGQGGKGGLPCPEPALQKKCPALRLLLLKWSRGATPEQSRVSRRRALTSLGTGRLPPATRAGDQVARALAVLPYRSPLLERRKLDYF